MILKSAGGKEQVTYKSRLIWIKPDFSTETLKAEEPGQLFYKHQETKYAILTTIPHKTMNHNERKKKNIS